MKKILQNKTSLLIPVLAITLVLGIYSCKKDASATSSIITEADAVELTSNAVLPGSGGLVSQVNSSIPVLKNFALDCGIRKDSTITRSSVTGAVPSYNFVFKANYLLTCSGALPSLLTFNFTGTSVYDGTRMSANDTGTGTIVLTGFDAKSTSYTANTTYARNGTEISKIGKKNTFTSTLTFQSKNILVDKTSLQIISGTAMVVVDAVSSSGKAFGYNGSVIFNGGNTATITLNSGTSFNIKW